MTALASAAPLAFTPPGAPVTTIAGLADGRSGDGRADADARAAGAVAWVRAGTGRWAAAVAPHAVTVPALTATMISEAIRTLSRIERAFFPR